MIFGLLPVKDPSQAKHRLGPVLNREEREQLARLMFAQALEVLLASRGLDRVVVASSDPAVLSAAAARGATALAETSQDGHSDSADCAARRAMEWGATTLLLAPSDVPLATAADVELVLQTALALPAPRLVIVPSTDGTGTNALVRTPPDLIQSRFGPGSFAAHLEQARARRAAVAVARPPGLVFDLDTPQDLAALLQRRPSGPIAEFLDRIQAARRLESTMPGQGE